jgi:enolase-phosphatase E1
VSFSLSAAGVRVVLLDIEGTTTPLEFVYGALFPFARERLPAYLKTAGSLDPEIAAAVAELHKEHAGDAANGQNVPAWIDEPVDAKLQSAVAYARWLMDRDRKSRPLKLLQGKIWEEGYRGGMLRGDVYPDVPGALRRWIAGGVGVGIYSSGSVLAQRLLFAHSTAGDLTPFVQWHFDTSVGSKMESASYQRIAQAIQATPAGILFMSDVARELDAAQAAGLQTMLCVRSAAERPAGSERYLVIHNFEEVLA